MVEPVRGGHPARWWRRQDDGRILCTLCPRFCRLGEGQSGFCFIRRHEKGALVSTGYGRPTGFAVDPIEKKPLHHFLPGSAILSFGTAGCNLGCRFCQNWDMSKTRQEEQRALWAEPEAVVALARRHACPSIAYTYNDPIIFAEYVIDIARRARAERIRSVLVTNGYVTPEARTELFQEIDGANVDLKGFTEQFYRKYTFAHLQPVLDTLLWLRRETSVWFEITTLLIPGLNDSDEEIRRESDWIVENLGDGVPLHFTAFHPDFQMQDRPRTPPETLQRARALAQGAGIRFVYVGNVYDPEAQTTRCPGCRKVLIERDGHAVRRNRLAGGKCPDCATAIPGVWE